MRRGGFIGFCCVQVPDLTIWYGPDTYMGENLYNMLTELAGMSDEQIREVHPEHDQVRDIDGSQRSIDPHPFPVAYFGAWNVYLICRGMDGTVMLFFFLPRLCSSLSFCKSVCLPFCLSLFHSLCVSVCLSICLSVLYPPPLSLRVNL